MRSLPDAWAWAQLGDMVDVLDHLRVPVNRAERAERVGRVPYYGATGQVGWIDEPLFTEELCLLGEDGAPFFDLAKAKAYVIDGPSWVNNHAHVLRARGCVTTRFLKYALDQVDYRPFVTGTTRAKLTKSAMSRIPIPVPPLAEQQRIVAAIEEQLSRLDAAEQSLRDASSKVAVLRAAIHVAATDGFESAELGALVAQLRYGTSVKCSYDAAGRPVLRIPNIQRGAVDLSDLKYATDARLDLSTLSVETGDLLFVRTNGSRDLIGRVACVDGAAGMAFASYLIRARPDPSRLDPRYAVIALSTPQTRSVIESKAATTAGQYNLNLAALRSLEIPLPPIDLQRSIVQEVEQRLASADAVEVEVSRGLRGSSTLRKAILARAFRGELVAQDPDDEPASVMLRRIAGERADAKPLRKRRVGTTA